MTWMVIISDAKVDRRAYFHDHRWWQVEEGSRLSSNMPVAHVPRIALRNRLRKGLYTSTSVSRRKYTLSCVSAPEWPSSLRAARSMVATGSVMQSSCSHVVICGRLMCMTSRRVALPPNPDRSKLRFPSKHTVVDNYMTHMPNIYAFTLQSPLTLSTSSQNCARFDARGVLGTRRGNC
ncbi:hypothetical protein HETIRDRAFT_107828 [Heterobasidion irregulare TC 32-1]|uniref:Uncharacterized protein n=1 Tax=Heterobasidion irregulare (strain TC 32-1) TaxID=747525 RepID=W4JZE0_HETIT|nr:uncharacterized protein HETIRDRAFT_107828 [Heterobasidion irregulare TC 32-1]ETW78236.1 hypothetical protein HETIRDRAFT_107828 [Heterobasidion irregulare TC 32-1]